MCEDSSDCSSGICVQGGCLNSLTQTSNDLGPSPNCENPEQPCYNGLTCTQPKCNRFNNACWCRRFKRKRSANEEQTQSKILSRNMTFVSGDPHDWEIECNNSADCPTVWFCEQRLCLAPLTFPSAAWASLSAASIGRIG